SVSGNSALSNSSGGGIFNYQNSTLTVLNSTLSGNIAGYFGGAVANTGTITMLSVTISGNSATAQGGGIYVKGSMDVRNTIIAVNSASTSGPDVSGHILSRGHNLIGNTQGGDGFDSTDLRNVNPRLGPLQDNGGPTQTMALLPGSPAVDAGDNANARDFDQRGDGFARIVGSTIDIGAFEAQIGSATSFRIDAPDSVPSGMPFDVSVTALDAYNHIATGYSGTVTFSTTDPDKGVVLPSDYTFTADDNGFHIFTDKGLGETTLITPGDQTVAATDTKDDTITGNALVTVTSGNAPRMGRGNHLGPTIEPVQLNTGNGDNFNPAGIVLGCTIDRKIATRFQDLFFIEDGLDFQQM
ncbi:MAG TPA: choice-of-anchor Q domain-containing protein, partial [Gemmataceae bacterium]|nr:choice-of-anchor Q domain-containing protein [Gemmataceae bacterium]